MIIGLIREDKVPHDFRVVLSPKQCKRIKDKNPNINFVVQPSNHRAFTDEAYAKKGIKVSEDLSSCDVLLGVKEVPIANLIPNKKYFFFSHTVKAQPYNAKLLKTMVDSNIEFYDWELLRQANGKRSIYFGRWAGIVGAYNGIKTLGKKYRLFDLPKAVDLDRKSEIEDLLKNLELPNVKIVITGKGHVAQGAREIMKDAKIVEVSIKQFLNEEFDHPVFVSIGCKDYAKRKDGSKFVQSEFFSNPELFESRFDRFYKQADVLITGHYWDNRSPRLWEIDEMKNENFKLSVIADVTCDINGSVPSTIRSSKISDPNYGFSPSKGEVDMMRDDAIAVMAVDNLPCELAKDSSEDFGEMFIEKVLPLIIHGDKDDILNNANMCKNGALRDRYSYLEEYIANT